MTPPLSQPFSVQGRVLLADLTPLVGAIVVAFDQDLRGTPQPLGAGGIVVTTDSEGRLRNPIYLRPVRERREGHGNLVVHVLSSAGILLAQSGVHFNAPATAILPDLTVDGRLPGIPSEYERLIAELTPLLINVDIPGPAAPTTVARLADLKRPDIDFLVEKPASPLPSSRRSSPRPSSASRPPRCTSTHPPRRGTGSPARACR